MLLYLKLMRLDKPIGILLLLWPTIWALCLAGCFQSNPSIFIIFIMGVIIMRSAGCVINDIFDQRYDARVKRTQSRPLATGHLSTQKAIVVFFALILIAASLLLFLNPLTRLLAMIGAAFTIIYPLLKRFTHLPQIGLGITFSWGIPMGFTACCNTFPIAALWLWIATFFWIVMYDTLYAMVDREDDIRAGVHSTARLFGRYDRWMIAFLQLATLICLSQIPFYFSVGHFFNSTLFITACLFIYQSYLIRDRQPTQCFKAFLNNHWIGFFIFIGCII